MTTPNERVQARANKIGYPGTHALLACDVLTSCKGLRAIQSSIRSADLGGSVEVLKLVLDLVEKIQSHHLYGTIGKGERQAFAYVLVLTSAKLFWGRTLKLSCWLFSMVSKPSGQSCFRFSSASSSSLSIHAAQ